MVQHTIAAFSLMAYVPGLLGQGAFPATCPMEGCLDKCCNIDCMDDCRFNKDLTCQACMPNCCKHACFQYCGDNVPMEDRADYQTEINSGALTKLYAATPVWVADYLPRAGIAFFAALSLFSAAALVVSSCRRPVEQSQADGFLSTEEHGAE
eukprot:gnl/MRDRNA2_/MRDRNA2_91337_c0_seq1.p1 gnl/MRDRNA2_/MRDRNA2_91337_c0~~gnl/MRDRNA2_/MRDRNA2_91337_c0_seq1.p1  ORF type:complete len:152 (+),score=22.74 gnl/MRDRNA2_/MRDRNA2_91337_c0_seq1:92-547(+)